MGEIWKVKGVGDPVLEIWEDYYGDLFKRIYIFHDSGFTEPFRK